MVRAAAAAVLALSLLAGCGADAASDDPDGGYNGAVLDQQYVVPDTPLTDTDGAPYSLAADTEQPLTLVFFGYTNCPDICQVVMSTIVSAVSRLSPEEKREVQVAFITTDPARDTPAKLRTYLDRFDPEYVGLTGPIKRIDQLAKPMDVFIKKGEKLPSGGYAVDHSTVVVAVDQGAGDLVWTGATSPADMAEDIEKILAAEQ